MLEIVLRPDETSVRGSRGTAWIAETTLGAETFAARSRSGASYALARILVAAGVEDQPFEVRQKGLVGSITWPSLHRHATRTIGESATVPVREQKWSEFRGVSRQTSEDAEATLE